MSAGFDTSIYKLPQQESVENRLLALGGASRLATAVEADQFALEMRRLDRLHQSVGSLAANPNSTVDDAHRALGDLVAIGAIPKDQAQHFTQQLEGLRANPTGFRSYLNTHLGNLQDARTNFSAAYGTPDVQDLGDNVLTRTVSPTMGVRPMAVSPKTLTPQDKAARVPIFQNGQPGTVQNSGLTDRYGNARTVPLGGAQAGAGGGAGGMAPAGFTPTAPGLGQARVAEGGADQYVRDLQAATNSAPELANLSAALGSLQGLGSEGTGPGTAGRKRIASFLNSAGLGRLPGVDLKKIEDLDEATAYLNSAAKAGTLNPVPGQAPGAGAPTTPDIGEISQPAAINLVRAQIGQKRLQQAQARSYRGQDNGAGYAQHAATFAGEQDPRAYSFDLRTPAEKQKLLDSLGPKDGPAYKKFIRSLRSAHDLGLTNGGQ
ncbi:hypothetical protein [Methylobacterium sp. R2-1]|uniref:hypothetical protein n=1 Tax=Methylobacterium sp. R2-1 TaxID=2587064 RepID=UPI00161B55FD|nr:hypothetical protein [Methylobacterium sp. R2-1]MBB2961811.1 hypothetical protein [Methylobacterium sp. R2-1]